MNLTQNLSDFINSAPTAYHAVGAIAAKLKSEGATELDEKARWTLEPGKSYYVSRSGSSLIAFRMGRKNPAESGFMIQGAHTDSPALKARLEKLLSGKGMDRAPVEIYGGPILSTWLDRPLALAGRVIMKNQRGQTESRLVHTKMPIGVIPNLAIHLNRDINKGFEYNAQTHLPVLLSASGKTEAATVSGLQKLLSEQFQIAPDAILGSDLYFVDAQGPAILGPAPELINSYRLDDLLGCHAILEAFCSTDAAEHTQVACFLDNEEIGSRTAQGADSSFLRDILSRISALQDESPEDFYRALAASFSISVDVAQAYHSSYPEKFDEDYAPILNGGPAVKVNGNLKYATDGDAEAQFHLLCDTAGIPFQKFMSRADMVPGTTIGPLTSSITGIKTVDIGAPLLSMHSIRETAGILDHEYMVQVLKRAFAG
ncbi:MAG TPA: M18 family aminopeptidase [Treponema sp.]|nr:M18 family aminopeptidase [Treponema sp.]